MSSPLGQRAAPAFFWDNRELLELGGRVSGGYQETGATYAPSTGWRPVAVAPAVLHVTNSGAVWTGREVFVFGSSPSGYAGLYDPVTNRWTLSRRAPLRTLHQRTAVWTGQRVIVAGIDLNGRLQVASYDPVQDRWTLLDPAVPASHHSQFIAIVATSTGVLLWSMWTHASPPYSSGGFGIDVYRLVKSGRWRTVTDSWHGNFVVRDPVFTGKEILLAPSYVWCPGCRGPRPFNLHGYLVDPRTLRTYTLPHGPLDDSLPQILWTGQAQISLCTGFGFYNSAVDNYQPGDIAFLDPATGAWSRGPRAPTQPSLAPAVWGAGTLFALAKDGSLLTYGPGGLR